MADADPFPRSEAPGRGTVNAPIRGWNADAPIHLLRSGEISECLNVNLANHGGALGRRGLFSETSGSDSCAGKLRALADWTDEYGQSWVAIQQLGVATVKRWSETAGFEDLGDASATALGSLLVFGTDLYYTDPAERWHVYDTAGSKTLQDDVWGISPARAAPGASVGTAGALDPGNYRYCLVGYDSKRDIEGQRGPFCAAVTVELGSGGLTGSVGLTWDANAIPAYGRFDKTRIYRTAPDTDFYARDETYGESFSQLAMLIGEVAKATYAYTDRKGKFDGDWDFYRLLQAAGEAPKCRLAVRYGNVVVFFSPTDRPGGWERGLPYKHTMIPRPFSVTENGESLLRVPHVDPGGGCSPLPGEPTALIRHQGQDLIFTRNAIYRLMGSPATPYVACVDEGHGAAGRWAIATSPYGVLFYDGGMLYRITGGSVEPFPVRGVQSILSGIAAGKRNDVCVGYCSDTQELLVAYLVDTAQYVLAFDFQRASWFRYSVGFTIYGFFEAATSGVGKRCYVMASTGMKYYPGLYNETITSAYGTIVYGTENLATEKQLKALGVSLASSTTTYALTVKGWWSSLDAANVATKSVTAVAGANSRLLHATSFSQLLGRFFTLKVEPTDPGYDWSLIGVDQFTTQEDLIHV